jgi:hypothetical protein
MLAGDKIIFTGRSFVMYAQKVPNPVDRPLLPLGDSRYYPCRVYIPARESSGTDAPDNTRRFRFSNGYRTHNHRNTNPRFNHTANSRDHGPGR